MQISSTDVGLDKLEHVVYGAMFYCVLSGIVFIRTVGHLELFSEN